MRAVLTSVGVLLIATLSPAASSGQELVVDGVIESTSGGVKYPDGSTQTTAFGANSVGSAEVVSSEVQLRVSDSCPAGSSIGLINANGTVICEPDDIKGWERVSFDFSCSNNFNCFVFVNCSSGKRVLGGGLELPGLDGGLWHLFTMTYSRPRDDISWEVGGSNATGSSVTMRVWAVCSPAVN